MHTLFWLALWLYGAGILLACVLKWWPGDRLQAIRLVNYLMPWLLTVLLPGLLLAALSHRYQLAVVLAAPALFICATYAPLWAPPRTDASAGGTPLKVMSYNVWRNNTDMAAVARVIHHQQPDLLLLQEIRSDGLKKLIAALKSLDDREVYSVAAAPIQQAVISRFPLKQLESSWKKGRTQKILATTPWGPLLVLNAHPPRGQWQRRHKQMALLLEADVAPAETPVILGGDFNTTDQSLTYRLIDRHLDNAHWQAGRGFGFTYPSSSYRFKGLIPCPPLVRIDHIFYSSHFEVSRAATLSDSGGSDHLPVVAELVLKGHRTAVVDAPPRPEEDPM